MHELGLCEDIVDAVTRRAGDRPVARVRIRVGALHHVHPEAFEQSFALAAAGTVADGARAELVLVPVTARCRGCGAVIEATEPVLGCASCGAVELDHSGGDEVLLESLEYRS
jgi:hydrogenase nickel incorporation protein HypA/HybF